MRKLVSILLILTLLILSSLTSCTLIGGEPGNQTNGNNESDNEENNSVPAPTGELEYELNDDGVSYSVIGFGTWQGLELAIPSEHNGLPVTAIAECAFWDDYRLLPIDLNKIDGRKPTVMITKVVIPDSVTTIGEAAFAFCCFLETVILPDSITDIGGGAFMDCSSLSNITIPSSVQTIGELAFTACKSLVNIHIPASVTSIGFGAFSGCRSLTKIDVDENNQHYTSVSNNLYSKDKKTFIQYALGQKDKSFSIPDTVENIEAYAFSFSNTLREITIPSSITKIEADTFYGCYSLAFVNIPTSVTSIEDCAFSDCYSLTSITIPESVTYLSDSAFSGSYLFEIYNKSSVQINMSCHIITDESDSYLRYVDDFVFYDDGTNVYLVRYIGDETNITLPQYGNHVEYGIYNYAFCEPMPEYNKPVLQQIMAEGNSKITSITIPDCVVSIGSFAFSGCTLLDSIIIPKSVTQMGSYVFNGCKSITIYCEAKRAPGGWDSWWNGSHYQLTTIHSTVWDCKNAEFPPKI